MVRESVGAVKARAGSVVAPDLKCIPARRFPFRRMLRCGAGSAPEVSLKFSDLVGFRSRPSYAILRASARFKANAGAFEGGTD